MSPRPAPALALVAKAAAAYLGFVLLAWPVAGPAFGAAAAWTLNRAWPQAGGVWLDFHTARPPGGPLMLNVAARTKSRPIYTAEFGVGVRRRLFSPIALAASLALATPAPWRRRSLLIAAAVGLTGALMTARFVIHVLAQTARAGRDAPAALFDPGPAGPALEWASTTLFLAATAGPVMAALAWAGSAWWLTSRDRVDAPADA